MAPLPFAEEGLEASPAKRGSGVSAAISIDGGLVLVGQSNGRAAYWLGEVP
jgi:hypothetical protein